MLFSSTVFLFAFLPIVFLLYFLGHPKLKNMILLAASLLFYAWGEPKFTIIMLLSILMNYVFALIVDAKREHGTAVKWVMSIMVLANLLLLGVFKYANFIVDNLNALIGTTIEIPSIPLPIGISFFTFQAMSYVIDVHRKDGRVQKNPINMALYISLFPQLIAGPIVRYQTVADQINKRIESLEKIAEGVRRFLIGLAKKMFLANNAGLVADQIFSQNPGEMSVGMAWIGIIAYSLQIYFDFSGYSDMAIGLGKMFGFDFLENFNYPYISKSATEFWRRWHISLGSWFRDYLYIPLGGNRKGEIRTYMNLFIVWFATGLWHGASWTFITWGLYYGFLIMLEKAFLLKLFKRIPNFLQHIYALLIVMIGWVFFRSETFTYAFDYIKTMFGLNGIGLWDEKAAFYTYEHGVILVLAIIGATPIVKMLLDWLSAENQNNVASIGKNIALNSYYVVIFVLSVIYVVSTTFNPFIYFRF
ncbi:MBOAT family O-acyltransferase [Mesobacillus jeotgali]|uniref:MBOAT family O-acyltransferase n=1 Tax=Mesobacillus jeotgali TaxID=129985 RepID=UPI0009A76246|nr:MBOAT family protein [Mesobacillus jeotgali]